MNFGREYEQAIDALRTARVLDPTIGEIQYWLAYACLRRARFAEAIAGLHALPEGAFSAAKWASLGEAHALAGDKAAAHDALQKLDSLAANGFVSPSCRVCVYAGLGEWDRVFKVLEQAPLYPAPWLSLAKVDPRYDPIRSDRRFQDLLARMHLL